MFIFSFGGVFAFDRLIRAISRPILYLSAIRAFDKSDSIFCSLFLKFQSFHLIERLWCFYANIYVQGCAFPFYSGVYVAGHFDNLAAVAFLSPPRSPAKSMREPQV